MMDSGENMQKSAKLILVAVLALSIGVAYASPMLITPINVQLFPRVPQGPKAPFSIDIVYANFEPVDFQYTTTEHDWDGNAYEKTYSATNISYNVVLNVTNLSDKPATLYELTFAAAQDVTVRNSILGGTMYDTGFRSNNLGAYYHFGAFAPGVYLDGNWVNNTWIPNFYDEVNGTLVQVPYPLCLYRITQAHWMDGVFSGPLTPFDVQALSADHKINGAIPELPANASDTGTWFEGVPITEYYDLAGNPLITMMYINGAWVDVTGKVTIANPQPMMVATNKLINAKLSLGAQPYSNMNSTVGPVTSLPTWGSWGTGIALPWFPWDWDRPGFNNIFAPHESRLIVLKNTELFIKTSENSPPTNGVLALQSGTLKLYASASNYISNQPINGIYYDTTSTATQVKELHFEQTTTGYVYNAILADNQTFQPGNSNLEVAVAPRIEP